MKPFGYLLATLSIFAAGTAHTQGIRGALDEGRRSLTGARLTATDKLQRTGGLPPEQLAAIDEMISDANKIWTACLIEYVDRAAPTPASSSEVVDQAMTQCTRDRDEMAAWIRLGGQAHHEQIPETRLSSFLAGRESEQAAAARNRLLKARASTR